MSEWLMLALSDFMRNIMMIAGITLLTVLLLINVRRRFKKGGMHTPGLTPHEKIERVKQGEGAKNDLRTMMVELEELSREFTAKLEAKSIELRKLIREAESMIAEMEKRGVGDGGGGRVAEPVKDDPLIEAEKVDPLTGRVYEMADAGYDAGEIAKKLSEPIGKVELILALRQTA